MTRVRSHARRIRTGAAVKVGAHNRAKARKARKYYLVEQTKDGLWWQVGHFHNRADAVRFEERLAGRTRIVHSWPMHDYPAAYRVAS